MRRMFKKEREDMTLCLAENLATERRSTPSPELSENVSISASDNEALDSKRQERKDAEDNELRERMKNAWDGLAEKHAAYQDQIRRDFKSNLRLDDVSKPKLPVGQLPLAPTADNTQSEMESMYNSMIKSLLERQSLKENNLLFLEKLNCACDSNSAPAKTSADCFGLPFFQFQFPKFDIETREHFTANVAAASAAAAAATVAHDVDDGNNDESDDILLDIKESSAVKISSDVIIISENVSLSTITEEVSGTPSELISISKESEQSQSKEQSVNKQEKEADLNATYCLKVVQPVACQQDVMHEQLQNQCRPCCTRNTALIPFAPCKFQLDKCITDAEKTCKSIMHSAKCSNVSSNACSARSDKCPRQSAGLFEPFLPLHTYGSTKTSFSTSDNESVVDNGSSVSFGLGDDHITEIVQPQLQLQPQPQPQLKPLPQSQSVPITSRASIPLNEDTHKIFHFGYSIPCTPKKLRWQDDSPDTKSNSLTPIFKSGRNTFRKEFDYDEGNETPSMFVIKNVHLESYDSATKANIVPPLSIADITPELSEPEDFRPISYSSRLSARTLQTIDHYNLECSSSLKENPKYAPLQEIKRTKYDDDSVSVRGRQIYYCFSYVSFDISGNHCHRKG